MGTYTGTEKDDLIVDDVLSAGVIADPPGSKPSDAADVINGLGGDDYVIGGGGGDTINGGAGDDNVLAEGAGNAIHGDAGDDYIGIEIVDSGGANPVTNTAWGDDGDDGISLIYHAEYNEGTWHGHGPTGTITLHGGGGIDRIDMYAEFFTGIDLTETTTFLYGDAGNDFLSATTYDPGGDGSFCLPGNLDHLYGGPGNDSYYIFENKDAVVEKANEGYDTIIFFEESYTGGNSEYILPANVEQLVLHYNYGDEPPFQSFHATGNALDNVIVGSNRNESLDGQAGNDTIYGGDGNDLPGEDIIHGGGGNDLIYGCSDNRNTTDGADQLYGDDGNDRIFGDYGDDLIYGGSGSDSLAGQAGDDSLWGGAGNDHLGGGTGDDLLYGEDGIDVLTGRDGADTLRGGAGNDRFVYEDIADSKAGLASHDVILDFAGIGKAGGDRIDLAQIDANLTKGGNQAFAFVASTAALKAGQLHVVAGNGSNSLVQGEVDGKAGVDFEIMVADGATKPGDWIAGDFIL